MARKTSFTYEDVLQAGFRLVDKEGYEYLTARNVAEELGSSTAPVYSNFSNMEELEKALVQDAVNRLLKATMSGKSGNPFLDIGLGVLDFAWDHPRWYESLFLKKNDDAGLGFEMMEKFLMAMDSMELFEKLDVTERTIVLKKMAIFTHGVATEICIRGGDQHSRDEWQLLLEEVGNTIVDDAFTRPPRSANEIESYGSLCASNNFHNPEKEED